MNIITPEIAGERLAAVRERLEKAAAKSGRRADEIALLAVSKTFSSEAVLSFIAAGQNDFGENYMQEAQAKISEVAERAQTTPRWHFIGHLQVNKAKYAAALFHALHSLDSLELAAGLNRRLAALEKRLSVYIQVNVAGETQKSGLAPQELPAFLDGLTKFNALDVSGLMTMPPYDPDPEKSRRHFAALRELRDKCAPELRGLSMGMSEDFEVAIEEGATIIRVGTDLFGTR